MKGRSACVLLSMLFFGMIVFGTTLCCADTYHSVYDSAFEEAISRSDSYGGFGDYNGLYYTMCDITGDGIDELIFNKSVDKHLRYFWVYGSSNSSPYYMGEVEEEAANQPAYGYKQGFIFTESYKGWIALYYAAWNGESFTKETLFEGSYDRNYEPPTVTDLYEFYDPDRLLEPFPAFLPVTDRQYLDREMEGSADGMKSEADSSSAADVTAENEPEHEQNSGYKDGSIKDPAVYNEFLSNFVTHNMRHFDVDHYDVAEMLNFIIYWYSRNNTIGYIENYGIPCISLENINLLMDALTGTTISEEEAESIPYNDDCYFSNGYYYTHLGDGEAITEFGIVKDVTELEDGNLMVDFSVFSLDLDRFFDLYDNVDNYFYMDYEEASNSSALTEIGNGTAIIRPVDNGIFPFHFVKFDCVTSRDYWDQAQTADSGQSSVSESQVEDATSDSVIIYPYTDVDISNMDVHVKEDMAKDRIMYNRFLSYFTTHNMRHFDVNHYDVAEMMKYIIYWCDRSHFRDYLEYHNGKTCISLDNINYLLNSLTGITISEEEAESIPYTDDCCFQDGYYYRRLADGEAITDFSVVKEVRQLGNGNREADFAVFSLNPDLCLAYDETVDDYIHMTYEEASNCSALTEIGYGTAILKPAGGGMFPFHFVKFDYVKGREAQTIESDQLTGYESEAEKSDVIDLALYLHTDIYKFKDAVGDMTDVHASDGTDFSNGSIIAGAPYDESEIIFFELRGDPTGYSILGIECGMDYNAAIDSINGRIDRLTSSEGNINYFALKDGNQLRVDYDGNGLVSNIDIWSDRTGTVNEWPGWRDSATSTVAGIDSNEPFISWTDAGIPDHEITFNDSAAEEKVRGLINKWDAPVYLSDLWDMTELDLTPTDENNKIRNIDFLQELRNLTVLNLNYNAITDISPVKYLTQLEGLFLNSNPVSDISVLSSMPWIARLDLSGTLIEDYTPLKGMEGLKTLHLYDNHITNDTIEYVIDCICRIPGLRKLNLGKNDFDDYSAFIWMGSIKTLSMWDSGLDDESLKELVRGILYLPNLQTLSLSNNNISDVSCLTSLYHLKKLIIYNNPVNDFSMLYDVTIKTDAKDIYTEEYLAFARKLQEEAGETRYMAIVKSEDPILLITDSAKKFDMYNETIAVDCDAYQYSMSKGKMVYIGRLKSGGTGSPLRSKDKSVRFYRHHDAYILTAEDGKAIVYAIHNANMESDKYSPDKTKYTLKNDEWTEISSKNISKEKAGKLHAKYIDGEIIDFKRVK